MTGRAYRLPDQSGPGYLGKSQAIETYLKLPPHPKVSLTGFYSAIVIQVSISVTFSKFQFEKLNTNSSKFWVISPPCG